MDKQDQVVEVMKYFQCSEQVAQKIIQASIRNGEIEKIKYMCKNDWKEKR